MFPEIMGLLVKQSSRSMSHCIGDHARDLYTFVFKSVLIHAFSINCFLFSQLESNSLVKY